MTFSKRTLSITTLSIQGLFATLSINDTLSVKYSILALNIEYFTLSVSFMLSVKCRNLHVVVLNVVMLNVIMLNVIMLNVVMLSVVAP
jgi:hypothetical protein